ncbi:hypothetical protein ACFW0P_00090 [Lysobacter soli]|uniref:hypothetical protein n=1 Tax=Lysobacter soli TaxID=453783 RepID=UPI0036BEDFFE
MEQKILPPSRAHAREHLPPALLGATLFAATTIACAQPSLDELHKRCHDYATNLPGSAAELKSRGFGPCDAYMFVLDQTSSPAHQVLAGIHMESINSALGRLDAEEAKPMVPGQVVPLVNARRVGYLWNARTPAGQLGSGDAWMVPELVTLLGSAEGFDYNQSGQIMTSAYAGMTAGGLREGPEWAALTTAVATFAAGRGGAAIDRSALIAQFPAAMAQLQTLPDDDYRRQRLYRAHLGRSELLDTSDPVGAFDELVTAHAMAQTVAPDEVGYVQLLMANALRDHTAVLAAQRRDQLMTIVETSRDDDHKGRILDELATTSADCSQVQQMFDLSLKFKSEEEAATPAAQLMLSVLYGAKDKADSLVTRLSCLDASRLQLADSDRNLAEWLQKVYPARQRDGGKISRAVGDIERKLKR